MEITKMTMDDKKLLMAALKTAGGRFNTRKDTKEDLPFLCQATKEPIAKACPIIFKTSKKTHKLGSFHSLPILIQWIVENVSDSEARGRIIQAQLQEHQQSQIPAVGAVGTLSADNLKDLDAWTELPGMLTYEEYLASRPKRKPRVKTEGEKVPKKAGKPKKQKPIKVLLQAGSNVLRASKNPEKAVKPLETSLEVARKRKALSARPGFTMTWSDGYLAEYVSTPMEVDEEDEEHAEDEEGSPKRPGKPNCWIAGAVGDVLISSHKKISLVLTE